MHDTNPTENDAEPAVPGPAKRAPRLAREGAVGGPIRSAAGDAARGATGEADAGAPALRSSAFLEGAMRRWGDTVLRLALSQLRDAVDAEDVFQDVFLRLLRNPTPFNDDDHLKAWLLRVTINRCRDIGRSGWKRRNIPLDERHADIEAPSLFASDVWEAVGKLDPDLRTVVHLHYVEGYSTDEVAALVGCRPATARTRLHRARKHMRALLETEGLAGRAGVPGGDPGALASAAGREPDAQRPTLSTIPAFRKGGRL